MKNTTHPLALAGLAAIGLAVSTASGQTFTTETLQADGSNITTSGVQSTFGAWSIDGGSGTTTLNGIDFTETDGSEGNFKLGGIAGGVETLTGTNSTLPYTGNMASLMEEHRVSKGSGVGGALNVSMENLTVGQDYRLQMLHDRGSDDTLRIDFFGNDFSNSVVATSGEFTVAGPGEGVLSTFEWTAGNATQRWKIAAVSGRGQLNGLVVQAIPEPATYGMMGGLQGQLAGFGRGFAPPSRPRVSPLTKTPKGRVIPANSFLGGARQARLFFAYDPAQVGVSASALFPALKENDRIPRE